MVQKETEFLFEIPHAQPTIWLIKTPLNTLQFPALMAKKYSWKWRYPDTLMLTTYFVPQKIVAYVFFFIFIYIDETYMHVSYDAIKTDFHNSRG